MSEVEPVMDFIKFAENWSVNRAQRECTWSEVDLLASSSKRAALSGTTSTAVFSALCCFCGSMRVC